MVHVFQTTHNLVISRCCFAEDGKDPYQELKHTCTAIALFSDLSYVVTLVIRLMEINYLVSDLHLISPMWQFSTLVDSCFEGSSNLKEP